MIEKEINTLITQKEYDNICSFFAVNPQSLLTQHNFYYDTLEATLKKHHTGLRIRIVNQKAEFTLKETLFEYEKRETTDTFFIEHIDNISFPMGKVSTILQKKYGITTKELVLIGQLVNERYEITTPQGIWEIDKSHFPSDISYELSLEYKENADAFYELLKKFNITYQKTPSKLARALFTNPS